MKRLIAFSIGCVLSAGVCAADELLKFEVATIKLPVMEAGVSSRTRQMGRERYLEGFSAEMLLREAFSLPQNGLVAPKLSETRYTVVGQEPGSFPMARRNEMLQSLLAERFGLQYHWEDHSFKGYLLVADERGPKLTASTAAYNTSMGTGMLKAKGISMAVFTSMLASQVQEPVLNSTELTASYDFELHWNTSDQPSPLDKYPDLVTAIREQLGLRLKAGQVPVHVLVVDSILKEPTAN